MASAPPISPQIQGGTSQDPSTLVEITISCRGLVDADVFSKSDPMCVVFSRPFGQDRFTEMMRTETIDNTLNPDFAKKVTMTYYFEEQQLLRFEVYDIDSPSSDLSSHDFLGRVDCSLGQIVSSGCYKVPLRGTTKKGPATGEIILFVEEMSTCKNDVRMKFMGKRLDKKDWFGKSDPFLKFYKSTETGQWLLTHKTEFIKRTLNPEWKMMEVPVRVLCNGDYDRNIKVECYDWNQNGSHALIGEFYTTINQLKQGPGPNNQYLLINPAYQVKKKNYKNSGEIFLVEFGIIPRYSFLDYVRGGTDLQCTIAIDFTASNGNPQNMDSLHYLHAAHGNPYERALTAVGQIIQDYDSDKQFPVLGFGARLPPHGHVSHEFFVNGRPDSPYCDGIHGVLSAYKSCVNRVQLYGPTNFAPVINHVARFASAHRDGSEYFILLIITDGIITDMPQTKQAIVSAAILPLSIIIVGVGDADFDAMEELDGDTVRLSYQGRYAERDIVQFVPFQSFTRGGNANIVRQQLAKEVLAEIPTQFLSYMKANRIVPNPPRYDEIQLPPDPEIT